MYMLEYNYGKKITKTSEKLLTQFAVCFTYTSLFKKVRTSNLIHAVLEVCH